MQEIQPKQRTFISRIESVTDTNVNNALFTLYGNLVEPLANIENMIATISVARKTQEECGTVITYSHPRTAFNALKKVPRNFIIFSIFMIIIYSTLGNWILNNFNTPKILDLIIDPPMTQAFVVFFIISTVLTFAMEFFNTSYNVGEQNKTRKKEYDKAKSEINRALKLLGVLPGEEGENKTDRELSSEIFDHAGDIYFWNQEPKQAVEFWKKALGLEPDNALIKKKVRDGTYHFE